MVRFTSQGSGSRSDATVRQYEVLATRHSGRGCTASAVVPVPPTSPGQRVRVTLTAKGPARVWCTGAYAGRVEETIRPWCPFREVCPQIAGPQFIASLTVGMFRFRVR